MTPNSTSPPPLNVAGLRSSDASVNLFGIQGEPNTGKTTSALTAPNPIVMDFDKKLPAGTQSIPFWDNNFIHDINKVKNNRDKVYPDRRQAVLTWLREEASKIPRDYTLILDSYTMGIDNMHNLYVAQNQQLFMTTGSSGSVSFNALKAFQDKLLFNIELFHILKSLNCLVIVTFHEQVERDKTTMKPTGKFRPLCTGGFKDQLAGNFGTIVRSVVETDKTTGKQSYRWHVKSDGYFNCQMAPHFKIPDNVSSIPNDYNELLKYKIS